MAQIWPPWDVTSSQKNLETLRDLVDNPTGIAAEPLGWLSRLLVIRSCGHLEQVVMECARGYVSAKSGGPVQAFGLTWLEKSRNPSAKTLGELAARFDPKWQVQFDALLAENDCRLSDDLGHLVTFRNRIAHGENQGVNRERSLRLSAAADEIADWWINTFNPF